MKFLGNIMRQIGKNIFESIIKFQEQKVKNKIYYL